MARLTIIDQININAIVSSSQLQIGDSQSINLRSRALAVQKDPPVYSGSEGNLSVFDIFRQPLPQATFTDRLTITSEHVVPLIKVNSIRVISAAASSMIHVGSSEDLYTESRIKHFRHYPTVPPGYYPRPELTIYT